MNHNLNVLIVGLGNPGKNYQNTRHNLGWMVLDLISEKCAAKFRVAGQSLIAKINTTISNDNAILLKPTTFMNNSGIAIIQIFQKYNLEPGNMVVVCDDFSIPLGTIRIRKQGSAGGHNGLQSIIQHLNTQEFPRIRLGIGPVPEYFDPKDFVLSQFHKTEKQTIQQMVNTAAESIFCILEHGIDKAMTRYNTSSKIVVSD